MATGSIPPVDGVTNTGTLTSGKVIVGNGSADIKVGLAGASSKLVGSGASGSGAAYDEITLGTNLSMSGTTLNATGGGGGWTLIDTKTASSSATLDFTSDITSTYNTYVFVFENIVNATNAQRFTVRLSSDNGSTFVATGYYDSNFYMGHNTGPTGDANSSTTSGFLSLAQDSANAVGLSGDLWLYAPLKNADRVYAGGKTSFSTASLIVRYDAGITLVSTAAWNAVRFLYEAGNIASGKIYLFGVQK